MLLFFFIIQNATYGVYSLLYRCGYFSQSFSGHCIFEAKKVQGLPSYLYIDKGATKKAQYLELISYPTQALHLLMTHSFPSVSCSFAGLTPFTQDALCLPPFTAQNSLYLGFPGGAAVENLPANARDTGSSPGLGRSHMPRSNWAREPQLLSLRVWSLCPATGGTAIARGPRTAMKSGPRLPQLEKALARNKDPTQLNK